MIRILVQAATLSLAATVAQAEGFITHSVEDTFADVAFAVESAILSKGLVIDSISHVGDMLERTRADVGSDKVLFTKADIYLFCSATVSRAAMEADPMNIQFCPYGITVMETPDAPGMVTVGFRDYPDGPMQQVEDLLQGIVSEALMLN